MKIQKEKVWEERENNEKALAELMKQFSMRKEIEL
jgi:hypothetical protein